MLPNLQLEKQPCVGDLVKLHYWSYGGGWWAQETSLSLHKGSFVALNAVTYILIKWWSIAGQKLLNHGQNT